MQPLRLKTQGIKQSKSQQGNIGQRQRNNKLSKTKPTFKVQAGDYSPHVGFLFPGQGAQQVGMAKDVCAQLPKAKSLFEEASDILGYDLLKICVEGPKDKLDSTAVSQPAIFVASLAALEKLKEEQPDVISQCDVTAGLSLGEYTALAFADVFSFADGVKLVQRRGEAMQQAADQAASGMTSVIGLDSTKVKELCEQAKQESGDPNGVLQIANYLCNGNYAVSGGIPQLEAVDKLAKPNFKARMTVRLAVAGAFHTSYMNPAVDSLKQVLSDTTFNKPKITVVSNVDALSHDDPQEIKNILGRQIISPVLWENLIQTLLQKGMQKSYEIGPNKVLAGIFKRIDKGHDIANITV